MLPDETRRAVVTEDLADPMHRSTDDPRHPAARDPLNDPDRADDSDRWAADEQRTDEPLDPDSADGADRADGGDHRTAEPLDRAGYDDTSADDAAIFDDRSDVTTDDPDRDSVVREGPGRDDHLTDNGQGHHDLTRDDPTDGVGHEAAAGSTAVIASTGHTGPDDRASGAPTALFGADEAEGFRDRWRELQIAFVDEPRSAVQNADELVAEVMQTLAGMFAASKQELEGQWRRDGEVETEQLRLALQRYRSFFDQLLRT